jgi:hypothetical protein
MLGSFSKLRSSEPETRDYINKILGTGAGNPTQVMGKGVTPTWVSTGLYRFMWKENPLNPIGLVGFSFEATTPAQLAGFSLVVTPWDSVNLKFDVSVFNSTFVLANLAAAQWLTLVFRFKETKL